MLTSLQLQLIKTFSKPIPERQVLDISNILAKYFLDEMDSELDNLTQNNNWTKQTFIDWSNEHNRSTATTDKQ